MIYVEIRGVKSEERGEAGGNIWVETDDVREAISEALEIFESTWSHFGHGACLTYRITVAPEASPRRTKGMAGRGNRPLPVESS